MGHGLLPLLNLGKNQCFVVQRWPRPVEPEQHLEVTLDLSESSLLRDRQVLRGRGVSLCGRLLAVLVVGVVLVEVGFGLTPHLGVALECCGPHVATNCALPGGNVGGVSLPPMVVAVSWRPPGLALRHCWCATGFAQALNGPSSPKGDSLPAIKGPVDSSIAVHLLPRIGRSAPTPTS